MSVSQKISHDVCVVNSKCLKVEGNLLTFLSFLCMCTPQVILHAVLFCPVQVLLHETLEALLFVGAHPTAFEKGERFADFSGQPVGKYFNVWRAHVGEGARIFQAQNCEGPAGRFHPAQPSHHATNAHGGEVTELFTA